MPSRSRETVANNADLAERVRSILASKGLTLYRVSQQSGVLYGRSAPHFVPHNLYYDLRTGSFTPGIHQVLALSRISGYRLPDWLRVFGFNLEDIARLQILLPSKRTILLDSSLTDANDWIRWFRNRPASTSLAAIAPLTQHLGMTGHRRIGLLSALGKQHFLYAKIGYEDAVAFPDLAPGSIVRVNPEFQEPLALQGKGPTSDRIFLIEHSKGFCCCRARIVKGDVIVPIGNLLLSYAQVELQRPLQGRILGVVDFEIRPLLRIENPQVPKDLARHWIPEPLGIGGDFRHLIERARKTTNLPLREAAAMSRTIGDVLNDDRYCISPSSFCDYELRNSPPRDFHKIIALCSLYGLQFQLLLKTIGIAPEDAGAESMPDAYISRSTPTNVTGNAYDEDVGRPRFLERLMEDCQQIPFFLRNSLEWFSQSTSISFDDFFWIGGERDPLHPYLVNGMLALVNRRRKTALHFVAKPWWLQPLYIILKRDGIYLAACCAVENGTLVVYPYTRDFHRPAQFRNHLDAEVVGQIVAIVRKHG